MNLQLVVKSADLSESKLVQSPVPKLIPGDILVRISKFGFTTNNITYCILGQSMKYFEFFPVEKGYGAVNVWGIAEIIESKFPGLKVGERVYGYFPASRYHILRPLALKEGHFMVGRNHLPAEMMVYNQYFRTERDLEYSKEFEDAMIIYRPLWGTAFFLDDFLQCNDYFKVDRIVISSASSKTATSFAWFLKQKGFTVIGLTSSRNKAYVESIELYNHVYTYDDKQVNHYEEEDSIGYIQFLYVDFAGDRVLNHLILNAFGDKMVKMISVGISHATVNPKNTSLVETEKSQVFFAPDWIKKRINVAGREIGVKKVDDWNRFLNWSSQRMKIVHANESSIVGIYSKMFNSQIKPEESYIVQFSGREVKL